MPVPPVLLPALITPFDDSGEIDLEAHRFNIKALTGRGIAGFLIAGSTGEGPYLDPGERRTLVEASRDELPDAYLTCGVAAETVRQARGMIAEATAGGADSVLVITPTTLTRNRVPYVNSYYLELAERSPLPILLYSVPAVTAFELPDESVIELSSHPNIVGIKDSGGHPVRLQRIVASVPADFMVFTGSTQAVALAIAAGAYGAITASTNYMPEKLLATVKAATVDANKARPLQAEMSRISVAIEAHGIPGVKYAAGVAGLQPGIPRRPLTEVGPAERHRINEILAV